MIMSRKHLLAYVLGLCAMSTTLQPQAQDTPQAPTQAGNKKAVAPTQQHQDEGQRIFEQNCSRCHTMPGGFSTRISGTIVMHMRIRASLSQHDAQELLRFLNP
jgi:cytochrome c5